MDVELTIEIFKGETGAYIAHCLELDIASQGEDPEDAGRMVGEAIRLVLEDAKTRGDLEELLESAGLELAEDGRVRRAPLRSLARLRVAVPA